MKILRDGKWERSLECADCQSLLLVEEDDVHFCPAIENADHGHEAFYFTCSKCSRSTEILADAILDRVKQVARNDHIPAECYSGPTMHIKHSILLPRQGQ